MTDLRQAAQQALEALEGWEHCKDWVWPVSALEQAMRNTTESLAALRKALEQQAEPPPEWPLIKNILSEYGLDAIAFVADFKAPQRTWVGLTPEEILDMFQETNVYGSKLVEFARTVEARLREKNT